MKSSYFILKIINFRKINYSKDNILLESNNLYEDSVYYAEFSNADAFKYGSISYNGRFFLNFVNDNIKYGIMLEN